MLRPEAKKIPIVHDISDSESEGQEKGIEFTTNQMSQFANLLSAAMGNALDTVVSARSQDPLGSQQPPGFPTGSRQNGGAHEEDLKHDSEDDEKGAGGGG